MITLNRGQLNAGSSDSAGLRHGAAFEVLVYWIGCARAKLRAAARSVKRVAFGSNPLQQRDPE